MRQCICFYYTPDVGICTITHFSPLSQFDILFSRCTTKLVHL
nr:MAG TPA: hypothetical protein [Caudoviricetes sp.]DAM52069.1 MAG TPA: hypothetical protein [Bacteriophage sp.]